MLILLQGAYAPMHMSIYIGWWMQIGHMSFKDKLSSKTGEMMAKQGQELLRLQRPRDELNGRHSRLCNRGYKNINNDLFK
jgi:hypothetical protein